MESIECLVALGGSVNAGNIDGRSPLHYAAMQGCFQCCAKLLELGADVTVSSTKGETPEMAARAYNFGDVAEMLQMRREGLGLALRTPGSCLCVRHTLARARALSLSITHTHTHTHTGCHR